MSKSDRTLYTVGHFTHSLEDFVSLLRHHAVNAIADVRSLPYSRMCPQFNREALYLATKKVGIAYAFLGDELGARPKDKSCYVGGTVQYDLLARTPLFQKGLSRIVEGMRRHRVTLLCAEKDPLTCHRTILVCRHLVEIHGLTVQHILADGTLEKHNAAMNRLLSETGLQPEYELFHSYADLIDEAYARRGKQIAYTINQSSDHALVNGDKP